MMDQKKKFYTRNDLCDLLGLGIVTIDKLLHRADDPIPCIRIGHQIRIPSEMFDKWVANETQKSTSDKFKKNRRKEK